MVQKNLTFVHCDYLIKQLSNGFLRVIACSMNLACFSTFGKHEKHSPAALVFLPLPENLCKFHVHGSILHGKPFGSSDIERLTD